MAQAASSTVTYTVTGGRAGRMGREISARAILVNAGAQTVPIRELFTPR